MEKIKPDQEHLISREEWEKEYDEIKKLRNNFYNLIKDICGEEDEWWDKDHEVYGLWEIQKNIIERYPNHSQYLAFHVICGGTTDYNLSPKVDFPGDLSVKQYYLDKIKELREKNSSKS